MGIDIEKLDYYQLTYYQLTIEIKFLNWDL